MSKTAAEIATEITVALANQVGPQNKNTLADTAELLAAAYVTIFKAVKDPFAASAADRFK
jgi:hypothetical protein